MKLNRIGKNPNDMLVAIDEEGKKIWYAATEAVYNNAKAINEGTEIEIIVSDQERAGLKIITFIKKAGTSTPAPNSLDKGHPDIRCTECGYALKDAKYTKCYNCNQKAKNDSTVKNFSSDSPKCIDCGKALKDSKYKKCFTCNQKNPVKPEKKSVYTSSTQESIERQNVNNAVSRSLIALQGRVDLNTIGDVIDILWEKFHSKLK